MKWKGRSEKSFPLASPATLMTLSHCWRRRPILSPSAPCFTRTPSTARRQETSRTRFTRYKLHLPPHPRRSGSCLISVLGLWPQILVVAVVTSGWYRLPRIPGVPRAPADLPHVVHRDCQFHRCRRWSLGLLSCVSALLNSHQTPPPPSCAHPYPEAFIVSFLLLCFLCAKSPFQFFQGQELN